jgi:hypothetical protein
MTGAFGAERGKGGISAAAFRHVIHDELLAESR